jgi:hypothetical protein
MSDFDVLLVGGGASAIFTLVQFTRELPSWRVGWVRDQPALVWPMRPRAHGTC